MLPWQSCKNLERFLFFNIVLLRIEWDKLSLWLSLKISIFEIIRNRRQTYNIYRELEHGSIFWSKLKKLKSEMIIINYNIPIKKSNEICAKTWIIIYHHNVTLIKIVQIIIK